MQGDVLPPSDAHAQLQAFQAIKPTYPFPIHPPAFAAQEHPDALGAEAGPGVGQLPYA
jgi:hypothetical protein